MTCPHVHTIGLVESRDGLRTTCLACAASLLVKDIEPAPVTHNCSRCEVAS